MLSLEEVVLVMRVAETVDEFKNGAVDPLLAREPPIGDELLAHEGLVIVISVVVFSTWTTVLAVLEAASQEEWPVDEALDSAEELKDAALSLCHSGLDDVAFQPWPMVLFPRELV